MGYVTLAVHRDTGAWVDLWDRRSVPPEDQVLLAFSSSDRALRVSRDARRPDGSRPWDLREMGSWGTVVDTIRRGLPWSRFLCMDPEGFPLPAAKLFPLGSLLEFYERLTPVAPAEDTRVAAPVSAEPTIQFGEALLEGRSVLRVQICGEETKRAVLVEEPGPLHKMVLVVQGEEVPFAPFSCHVFIDQDKRIPGHYCMELRLVEPTDEDLRALRNAGFIIDDDHWP